MGNDCEGNEEWGKERIVSWLTQNFIIPLMCSRFNSSRILENYSVKWGGAWAKSACLLVTLPYGSGETRCFVCVCVCDEVILQWGWHSKRHTVLQAAIPPPTAGRYRLGAAHFTTKYLSLRGLGEAIRANLHAPRLALPTVMLGYFLVAVWKRKRGSKKRQVQEDITVYGGNSWYTAWWNEDDSFFLLKTCERMLNDKMQSSSFVSKNTARKTS